MQEITLKLPIERVVGGTLTAGDTVGVFLSVEDSAAKSGGTQLTFHKVLVTAAQFSNGSTAKSQETAAEEDSSKGALNSKKSTSSDGTYLITLARNSADAERIIFATEFGSVYLSKEPANAVGGHVGRRSEHRKAVPMSRFVLITPEADFERRMQLAVSGMHGSLRVFQADYLPESPQDFLRQLVGEPPEVLILGPGPAR